MLKLCVFLVMVGQTGLFGFMLPPPPVRQTSCPTGFVAIGRGNWVAQGSFDTQNRTLYIAAGPWQVRESHVDKGDCANCQTFFPATCVADFQGSQTIQTDAGKIWVHVYSQTRWLPARGGR